MKPAHKLNTYISVLSVFLHIYYQYRYYRMGIGYIKYYVTYMSYKYYHCMLFNEKKWSMENE